MKSLLCFIVLLILMPTSYADIETDKTVGNCMGLLSSLRKSEATVANALSFVDNQNRALKFGMAWLNEIKRYSGDKNMVEAMVYSATSDCRKIGIRSSD